MFVVLGCPIYDRAWILPQWLACIEQQDIGLENLGFVFIGAPEDKETHDILFEFQEKHPELRCFDLTIDEKEEHRSHPEGQRSWPRERYKAMARMRNLLLARVNVHRPDRFLSLDSDMLLENPRTISELAQITAVVDAASPLAYMTFQGIRFPNFMSWVTVPGGKAARLYDYPIGQLFKVDVIMATVMMNKLVYENTLYEWHRQGEDLGWSTDCFRKGFRLYSASYLYVPHIMSRGALDEYNKNGDPRREMVDSI